MIPRPGWYVRGKYYELGRTRQSGSGLVSIATGILLLTKIIVFDDVTIPQVMCLPLSAWGAGVRCQVGYYAIDPNVGHAVGAPLAQTGPFAVPGSTPVVAPLLAPLTLTPGAYRRAAAVSATSGNMLGSSSTSEACDDQGNVAVALTRAWSIPWVYSASGLPTIAPGLTWTAQGLSPLFWSQIT